MGFVSAGKPLLTDSHHVVYNVAKSKKPHTVTEELIKSCVFQITAVVLEKKASKKLELDPLSKILYKVS